MRNEPEPARARAWQPLTPGGIAAFSRDPLGRLLLVQSLFALAITAVVLWVLCTAWTPRVSDAIKHLPGGTEIRQGELLWPGEWPAQLSESRFLALTVDLDHSGKARSPAHIQVEFARRDLRIFSMFGYLQLAYPAGGVFKAGPHELQPWWGAWLPALVVVAGLGLFFGLMLFWVFLASLYSGPGLLVAFFLNRSLSPAGSWRLCGAALMPGALFMTLAIYCYRIGMLDPVRLMAALFCHFLIGWICVVLGCWALGCSPAAPAKSNPFQTPAGETKSS